MSSRDEKDIVDFKLVTTYLPIIIIMLRTGVLWFCIEITRGLSTCRVSSLIVCLVGADCIVCKHDRFSQICGFCIAPGIAFLLNLGNCSSVEQLATREPMLGFSYTSSCVDTVNVILHWTVHVLWGVGSAILLAHNILGLKVSFKATCVVLGILLLLLHFFCECDRIGSLEILLRSCMFYVFCLLFYYGSDSHGDLESLSFLTPHLGMHLLFVEKIMLAASVVIYTSLLARLYYQKLDKAQLGLHVLHTHTAAHTAGSKKSTGTELKAEHGEAGESQEDLLKQLRLAQNKKATPV